MLVSPPTDLDEDEITDFIRDTGLVAWRAVEDAATDHDAVVDVFGALLDYISATLGTDLDVINEDDVPSNVFGISCAGGLPTECVAM